MKENRRHDRVYSRMRCWCEGSAVTVLAPIGNLSEGGVFVRTLTPFAQGAATQLRFGIPGVREVEAVARVVWHRKDGPEGPGMGLEFETLAPPEKLELRRLIQQEQRLGTSARS